MDLYAAEGAAAEKLPGIPVFQAEGLTISSDKAVREEMRVGIA